MRKNNDNKTNSLIIKPIIYGDLLMNKNKILRHNKWRSGIFILRNIKNYESYIGSSIHLHVRLGDYYNINYIHRVLGKGKSHICGALLVYGHTAFHLEILEYCSEQFLRDRKQHYLDLFNPEYNIKKKTTRSVSKTGHPTIVSNKKDYSIKTYNSMSAAARYIGVSCSTVAHYANRNKLLKNVYLITKTPINVK